jgi:hypothetical protein
VHSDLGFTAGNLWFVPVEGKHGDIERLAEFVFVRVIRPVPKLRGMRPVHRSGGVSVGCSLPTEQPLSSEPKVAILDGGLPKQHAIGPWLRSYRVLDEDAATIRKAWSMVWQSRRHSCSARSSRMALLPPLRLRRSFARARQRCRDGEDPLELYRTLGFVEQVLLSRQYQFINLSLGPDLPIEDTDVHAWTSVIDDLLSDGDTLMTVAIGNNGERTGLGQCPRAGAFGLRECVGGRRGQRYGSRLGPRALQRDRSWPQPWRRQTGPDGLRRRCGQVFPCAGVRQEARADAALGTSFASPYLLRSAVGIRAILGTELTPLAIKALLVHAAEAMEHDKLEVGWGKVPEDLMSIITCPEGVARVVYQGELKPGKYLRASLPLPAGGLNGNIRLKATFCYASPTDPQDAAAYTRAGLETVFRPNDEKIKDGKANADTKGFFDMKKYATEEERRSDMGKWETVLHGAKSMRGTSLKNPVFDIHYNAREAGGRATGAEKIRYALIITVEAPKHVDLYNEILRAYAKTLVPIQPQVSLPIRV